MYLICLGNWIEDSKVGHNGTLKNAKNKNIKTENIKKLGEKI